MRHCTSSICGSIMYAVLEKSNPTHPRYGALPGPHVPVLVTSSALVEHCCRSSQYHRTFIVLSVFLWKDLGDHVFNSVGLAGFKSRANAFLLA